MFITYVLAAEGFFSLTAPEPKSRFQSQRETEPQNGDKPSTRQANKSSPVFPP